MTFSTLSALPGTEMLPGVTRRAVHLDHAMMTFFHFDPGSVVPEHTHPHEQITYVVEGGMEFTLGGTRRLMRAGDVVCIPPHVPHSATILDQPTFALDAWYPLREEYR
jgi:quercetin dioxygenase-like cupin family protein